MQDRKEGGMIFTLRKEKRKREEEKTNDYKRKKNNNNIRFVFIKRLLSLILNQRLYSPFFVLPFMETSLFVKKK
jgi:hypothetical protein